MLFNEPKLLKSYTVSFNPDDFVSFSALQRAEIAEIERLLYATLENDRFSALQRAEIAEMLCAHSRLCTASSFSALQRAEIAEILVLRCDL